MSQATLARPKPPAPKSQTVEAPPQTAALRCAACNYPRVGIAPAALCPECGHDPLEAPLPSARLDSEAWWARGVMAGLLVLGLASFVMLGVTAYMRFRADWGGSLPILNYVGPKIWGAGLLQRSIGTAPGAWGVDGTRFGLLAAVGVWLITLPRPAERDGEPLWSLRRLCRWGTLVPLGAVLGLLLSEDGVLAWEDGARDDYHLLLLSVVELPATMLLYLYLRHIAVALKDRALATSLRWVSALIPAVMAGAVIVMLAGDAWQDARQELVQQAIVAFYGAACVGVSMLGLAACCRLLLALAPTALGPAGGGELTAAAVLRSVRWRQWTDRLRGRLGAIGIAGGLLAWVACSLLLVGDALHFNLRGGYGGNWPMLNVPGPKVWATVLALRFDHARWEYSGMFAGWTEVALRVLLVVGCVWAVTARPAAIDAARLTLRPIARWGVTILVGIAFAVVLSADAFGRSPWVSSLHATTLASAYTVPLTMFVEAPATLLIFLYLAQLARAIDRPNLGRQTAWAGILSASLIVAANAFFAASRLLPYHVWRGDAWASVPVVIYGATAITVGIWSGFVVLRVAGAALSYSSKPSIVTI